MGQEAPDKKPQINTTVKALEITIAVSANCYRHTAELNV